MSKVVKMVNNMKTFVKNMHEEVAENRPEHWRFEHGYVNDNNLK